jgi:hypothetical protein
LSDFTLLAKLIWSKNVMEQRDAPDQILLGVMDPNYCILLSLGIYIEVWTEHHYGLHHPYLFGASANPKNNKDNISDILRDKVWAKEEFVRLMPGPIDTHSLRKFPSTRARRAGCSKDDVDVHGRWRNVRVLDRYMLMWSFDPYPDAKVAAVLCQGGPIKYVLRQGSGVTEDWLRAFVVPNTVLFKPHLHREIVKVLALPVLWASTSARNGVKHASSAMRTRIQDSYGMIFMPRPYHKTGMELVSLGNVRAK